MISLNIDNNSSRKYDRTNSILIIGKAETEYQNRIINKAIGINYVEDLYGTDSELTKAYYEALEIGATNIFLCNCYKFTDYLKIAQELMNEEFDYICPLFNFSETFTIQNTNMYLGEFFSNILSENITQIFLTDKHASLYENLDQYIKEMNDIVYSFKKDKMDKLINGQNLCFVLNNLLNYNYANVALASIISQADLKEYPQKDIGDVVFTLNNLDFLDKEIAYFSYDSISKTTIENFLNFNINADPLKFVPICIIQQKILRALDLSEFKGKLLTAYLRIAIENKVNKILAKFQGKLIEGFKLIDINYIDNKDGTVTIKIYISIKPYNSIENINLELEM